MTQTVTGSVPSEALGATSIHEHIPIDKAGPHRDDAVEFALKELKAAKVLGLQSIVEVSPTRDVVGIKQISAEAEVHVVVCTGFYTFENEIEHYSDEQFYRHMMDEITNSIDGTGIYPGVIKIASHNASLSAVETRADLRKVYFSHTEAVFGWEGRTIEEELEVLCAVVSKGSVLSYNNFGNTAHTAEEQMTRIVKTLIDRGYEDYHTATMDTVWSYSEGDRKILWEEINRDGQLRTYQYLFSHVVPSLRAAGIADRCIEKMFVDTPRRLFDL